MRTRRYVLIFIIFFFFSIATVFVFPLQRGIYIAEAAKRQDITEDENHLVQRLLFVGDTGNIEPNEPSSVLDGVVHGAAKQPAKTTVVMLGDNVYPHGIPANNAPDFKPAVLKLAAQVRKLKSSKARFFFLPGNHDWGVYGKQDQQYIRNQIAVVDKAAGAAGHFVPADTCPGPHLIELGKNLRLLVFDIQPLLAKTLSGSKCAVRSVEDIAAAFSAISAPAEGVDTIFIQHHPLRSYGRHSGEYSWMEHLFPLRYLNGNLYLPLPLLGSAVLGAVHYARCPQHLGCAPYRELINTLRGVLKPFTPLLCVGAHDHNLQVLEGDGVCQKFLVSGSGSKQDYVGHRNDSWFSANLPGFMRVDRYENGNILLAVHVRESGKETVVFRKWIRKNTKG